MNSDFSKLSKEERDLRITALILGELSPAEAEEVRQAIAADAELAREYELRKQTIELVRETAAMDRKVSADGTPLKLDDERRQKLLERFKTPAPRAAVPRRPRNLWYVPMSIAAVLVGLLVVVIGLPGGLRGAREMARRTPLPGARLAAEFAGESASPGSHWYFAAPRHARIDAATPLDAVVALKGSSAEDGQIASGPRNERPVLNQPIDGLPKAVPSVAIALPATTDADGDERFQISGKVADLGAERMLLEQFNEQPLRSDIVVTRKLQVDGKSADANDFSTIAAAPSSDGLVVAKEIANNPAPIVGDWLVRAEPNLEMKKSITVGGSDSTRAIAESSGSMIAPTWGATTNGVASLTVTPSSTSASYAFALSAVDAVQDLSAAKSFGGLPVTAPVPAQVQPAPVPNSVFSANAVGYVNIDLLPTAQMITNYLNFRSDFSDRYNNRAIILPDAGVTPAIDQNGQQNVTLYDNDYDPAAVAAQIQGVGGGRAAYAGVSSTGQKDGGGQAVGGGIFGGGFSPSRMDGSAVEGTRFGSGGRGSFRNRLGGAVQVAAGPAGGTDRPQISQANAFPSFRITPGSANSPAGSQVTYSNLGTATTRGFYDDNVNTGSISDPTRAASDANGRFDIQLPAQANEAQLSRQSSPTRAEGENKATGRSPAFTKNVFDTLQGADAAGLPIAPKEMKERLAQRTSQAQTGGSVVSLEEKQLEKRDVPAQPEADISQVLNLYAELTGKTLLKSPQVPTGGRISIPDQTKLSKEERISALNTALGVNQISMVPEGEKFINVVPQAGIPQEAQATKPPNVVVESLSTDPPRPAAKPSIPAPTPQPEVLTRDNAFSTFSLNVADVSFKLAAASLEKGAMPDVATIRSEEFINAFDYRDPQPLQGVPIAFAWERARYPFAHNRDVVRFSIKTAAQGREAGKPLNIVLCLDNSGSMERADRVRIIQESLRSLAAQLKPQDKLSVVTFSRTARLWADGVSGAQAAEVAKQIGALTPEGGTNLEDALDLAYRTALRHYAATAVNRVVLLTDGAANLGNVEPQSLKQKIENFRKQGVALDCFGIGWEGFNDDLLEQLSRNGDGRYGFVNTPEEAASEFVGQLAGALRVAASDVKVQVEFNPKRVTAYRQIGYAKHQLTKEQFRDNKVDAAEIGAAEAGNALYIVETNPRGEGPIATVRARFRIPQTSDYREHEWVVPYGSVVELEQSSPAMRLAASASAFSEWLASSPFAAEITTDRLLGILSGVPEVYGADPRPKRLEWMIRQAKSISGK